MHLLKAVICTARVRRLSTLSCMLEGTAHLLVYPVRRDWARCSPDPIVIADVVIEMQELERYGVVVQRELCLYLVSRCLSGYISYLEYHLAFRHAHTPWYRRDRDYEHSVPV